MNSQSSSINSTCEGSVWIYNYESRATIIFRASICQCQQQGLRKFRNGSLVIMTEGKYQSKKERKTKKCFYDHKQININYYNA